MKNKRTKDILIYVAVAIICALISGTVAGLVGTIDVGATETVFTSEAEPAINIPTVSYYGMLTRVTCANGHIITADQKIYNSRADYNLTNYEIYVEASNYNNFTVTLNGWLFMTGGVDSYTITVRSSTFTQYFEDVYNYGGEPWMGLLNDAKANGYNGDEKNAVYQLEINLNSFVGETVDIYLMANKDGASYPVVLVESLNVVCYHSSEEAVTRPGTNNNHYSEKMCAYCNYLISSVEEPCDFSSGVCVCGNKEISYDVNGDGLVNKTDVDLVQQYAYEKISDENADFDGDSVVTLSDYVIIFNYYYQTLGYKYDVDGDGFIRKADVELVQELANAKDTHEYADYNNNGFVDLEDYTEISNYYFNTLKARLDFNQDSIIDQSDVDYIRQAVLNDDSDPVYDVDDNGVVNSADVLWVQYYFIDNTSSPSEEDTSTETETETEAPVEEEIDFDINKDGKCDGKDIELMKTLAENCEADPKIEGSVWSYESYDFNGNGMIDLEDYVTFSNAFYKKYPPTSFYVELSKLAGATSLDINSAVLDNAISYTVNLEPDAHNRILVEGFCAINSGVDKYTYSIVSDDGIGMSGIAVINNYSGYKATDSQKAAVGYTGLMIENYDVNSRFQFYVDLSGYEGKTVTVTVSARSNDDQTEEIVKLKDIQVPSEEESETESGTGTSAPGGAGSGANKGDKKINTSFIAIIPMAALVIGGIALLDYIQKSEKRKS